jgi:hypothetical protein
VLVIDHHLVMLNQFLDKYFVIDHFQLILFELEVVEYELVLDLFLDEQVEVLVLIEKFEEVMVDFFHQ